MKTQIIFLFFLLTPTLTIVQAQDRSPDRDSSILGVPVLIGYDEAWVFARLVHRDTAYAIDSLSGAKYDYEKDSQKIYQIVWSLKRHQQDSFLTNLSVHIVSESEYFMTLETHEWYLNILESGIVGYCKEQGTWPKKPSVFFQKYGSTDYEITHKKGRDDTAFVFQEIIADLIPKCLEAIYLRRKIPDR